MSSEVKKRKVDPNDPERRSVDPLANISIIMRRRNDILNNILLIVSSDTPGGSKFYKKSISFSRDNREMMIFELIDLLNLLVSDPVRKNRTLEYAGNKYRYLPMVLYLINDPEDFKKRYPDEYEKMKSTSKIPCGYFFNESTFEEVYLVNVTSENFCGDSRLYNLHILEKYEE